MIIKQKNVGGVKYRSCLGNAQVTNCVPSSQETHNLTADMDHLLHTLFLIQHIFPKSTCKSAVVVVFYCGKGRESQLVAALRLAETQASHRFCRSASLPGGFADSPQVQRGWTRLHWMTSSKVVRLRETTREPPRFRAKRISPAHLPLKHKTRATSTSQTDS